MKYYSFNHNRSLKITGLSLLLTCTVSCKKFVLVDPPINQVVSSVVFTSDPTATAAVLGVYSKIMGTNEQFLNGAISLYSSLSSDELRTAQPVANADPFALNVIPASSSIVKSNFWTAAYFHIRQINLCIEGISNSEALSPANKTQLLGESKFMRALCYFYLVNIFGDVPLEITSDYRLNESAPRTSSVIIYKQILADLYDAQSLLTAAYPVTGPVRPNKWAATALLARVQLYQQNWAGADSAASAVINSGAYSMVPDLNNVFLANSPEAILQFVPNQSTFNTSEGRSFNQFGTTAIPNYTLTSFLLTAFEPLDNRAIKWLNKFTVLGNSYTVPYKYKINTNTVTPKTEYNMVLRLAEQYLIRAEARSQEASPNISGAVADLNVIRLRAGLSATTATTQATLLTAIAHERQVELFAEWGHRWFDLKRTGTVNTVLGTEKTGWQPNAALYPIPFTELQLNPFLTQNTGY